MALVTKLKEYRENAGMKQSELAEKVNARRETIVHLENGRYNPSLKLAMDIAKVFGVSVEDLFNNPYTPQKRRYTMILTPIFTSEDHHGLFLCEADISRFHHIYSISLELGTTLKFLKMYEEQQQTNQQLEYTLSVLHEKNRQLSKISTIDELTGLKNRRGFLTETQTVISSSINHGQRAILLFADMDNLKIVNDKFGHEYGDMAVKVIARAILKYCSEDAIPIRMGGDEFLIIEKMMSDEEIRREIEDMRQEVRNESLSKKFPFDMSFSIGCIKTDVNEDKELDDYVKEADETMYQEKYIKKANRTE